MYLLEFMYLVFTHLPGYRKCSIHHITPNGQRKVLKPALAAMLSMGKHWKRVPEQGPVVHPCWGHWTVGFLWRNLWECTRKVKSVTNTTMVCPTLECALAVWCPHKHKDIQLLEQFQAEQPGTWPTTTRTDHQALLQPCSKIWSGQVLNNDDRMVYKIINGPVDINQHIYTVPDDCAL